jgi:SagB-type dehydrogenase family enzyme
MLELEASSLVVTHYVARRRSIASELTAAILIRLADWMEPATIFDELSPRDAVAAELLRLLDQEMVVSEGTAAAERDARFEGLWEWGATAGVFHFGIRNTTYLDPSSATAFLEARGATREPPPLFADADADDRSIALPMPSPGDDRLLPILRKRRSRRCFGDAPLELAVLSDCLFASMAIVGYGRVDRHEFPLTMTPSGGARNPFDAYVVARAVAGLEPGIFRYLAAAHRLARRGESPAPPIPGLLGGQSWFAKAGALVVLVANFRRTMWKYPHPSGLRVVLIEAGHIAQNILVTAAHHGVAAAPTCAVSDAPLEELCGLDPLCQAAVHVIALGTRSDEQSTADFRDAVENQLLPGWLDKP